MVKKIINSFKTLDKTATKIMKTGIKYCFFISIISSFILLFYNFFNTSPIVFYIGLSIFKLSLTFTVEFIICAFSIDFIKRELT